MKNHIGICKFCGEERQLVKSHIIPKCMQLQSKGEKLQVIKSDSNFIDIVNYQNGYTENNILCKECDGNLIGPLDKFAKEFFLKDFFHYTRTYGPYRIFVIPLDLNQYVKLKKFVASVVLRASLSKNLLGDKYTQKFVKYLKGTIDDIEELEIIVRKVGNPFPNFNLMPYRSRIVERRCYLFQSFGYEFICKVDSQAWDKSQDCLLLKDNVFPILQVDRQETLGYDQLMKNVSYYLRNNKKK